MNMEDKLKMVLGVAFDSSRTSLVTIRKNRPSFLAGKLNGVGGKVEQDEMAKTAMVREFMEETGVQTTESDWRACGMVEGDKYVIFVYAMQNDAIFGCKTMEDEEIIILADWKNNIREMDETFVSLVAAGKGSNITLIV